MKDRKTYIKKYIIVILIVLVYIVAAVSISIVLRKKNGGLDVGVTMYGLSEDSKIDASFINDSNKKSYMMSNKKNNSVYYNAPLLNTGFVTEALKSDSYETNYTPAMVVGEGVHKDNTTIVKILNEQQACITQFLAYPSNVFGGVNVAAGKTVIGEKEVTLIATAAGGAYCDEARAVRVFDCSGMIYMSIIPKFYNNAPYSIATGHFVKNDSNEYLMISSGYVKNGRVEMSLYSFADGKNIKQFSFDIGKEYNDKQVFINTRNNTDKEDNLIIFIKGKALPTRLSGENLEQYTDEHAVFEADMSGKIVKSEIKIPTDADMVYSSANQNEQYLITSSGEVHSEYNSYYYSYAKGETEAKIIRLDSHESNFYWNADEEYLYLYDDISSNDGYIRFAESIELLQGSNGEVSGFDKISNISDEGSMASKSAFWRLKLTEYNLYPIKSAYREIAKAYRSNPEAVVAIELFSEKIFDDIYDEKDLYESDGSVSQELLYKVAVRMNRLYSEALLAGIPPEALTSDLSLREGAFVQNTDGSKILPGLITDSQLYSFNVPFGTHTYGIWYTDSYSVLQLAKKSGYKNYTISSYSAETDDYDLALYQLLYLLRNGCRYVEIDTPNLDYAATELNALEVLRESKEARFSYASGSSSAVAVNNNGKAYNIICLGGSNSNGMIKSVDENGNHDGSIYVVPFHSKVEIQKNNIKGNPRYEKSVREYKNINAGSQIELTFNGKYTGKGNAYFKINVFEGDKLIEDACVNYQLTSEKQYYRYVFSTQYDIDKLTFEIDFECDTYSDYKISNIELTLQQNCISNPNFDSYSGVSFYGGVTLDVLDRDSVHNK